jgi:recombinational DNA repair ATPase RecF
MLTRLYIDNFRCFVNFEYRPARRQLIVGRNGSGKSSLLDVLLFLRQESALVEAGLAPRSLDERIVHLVARRSVETWVLCLSGRTVDEETDYGGEPEIDRQIAAAAETLFAWTRVNATPPQHCISSLRLAIPELRRLE